MTFTALVAGTAEVTFTVKVGEVVVGTAKITVNVVDSSTDAIASVVIDFSDPSTYTWITTDEDGKIANATTYPEKGGEYTDATFGILSLVTTAGTSTQMSVKDNALNGAGASNSSGGVYGRYFEIDFSESYVGCYATISVSYATTGSETSLLLGTDKSVKDIDSSLVAYSTETEQNATEFTYTLIVPDEGETLYLTWSANINIYSISVIITEKGEITPAVESVAIDGADTGIELEVEDDTNNTAKLTYTVTMAGGGEYSGGYTWTTSKASVATVSVDEDGTVTVTAVGAGEAEITVMLWDDPSKTASIKITVTTDIVDDRVFEEIASIDFTGYTANETLTDGSGADVEIVGGDGNGTGFYVTNGNNKTTIKIQKQKMSLNFGGTATESQNSIYYTLQEGTYRITISYFSGTAGRYATVICGSYEDLGADSDELTDSAGTIVSRTIEITIENETNVYIGSAKDGLYIASIVIEALQETV